MMKLTSFPVSAALGLSVCLSVCLSDLQYRFRLRIVTVFCFVFLSHCISEIMDEVCRFQNLDPQCECKATDAGLSP
jgi:hypothetical protein